MKYKNLFSWVVLLHSGAFVLFWLTNRFFYADTNHYLASMLGISVDYISLCLGFASLMVGWSVVQAIWPINPARVGSGAFAAFGVIFVVFFYGSFVLLFRESPAQLTRLGYLLHYHRLLVDISVWIGLVFLARRARARWPSKWWAWAVLLLIVWSAAAVVPPGAVYTSLPEKPRLVAHRGASMLAPENTAEAAGLAIQSGAFGLESDVRVSLDGQLFLMHDTTLARTTNVESVFLQRTQERAESFTRAELDRLHAGAWFVTADPFGTIQNGDISQDQRDRYERVRLPIPAFADWLEDVRQASVIFIFDLQPAPSEHPFAGELLRFALEEIQAAGVDDKIWLLVDPTQAALLAKSHPAIWRAAGIGAGSPPPAHKLVAQGYELVNAGFDLPLDAISNYRKAGLWVNLWTIDEPWLYSFFWLRGLDSVTTNNVHTLSKLALPVLAVPTPVYLAVWAFLGLIGCIAALWRKP